MRQPQDAQNLDAGASGDLGGSGRVALVAVFTSAKRCSAATAMVRRSGAQATCRGLPT
ncbi:MAG: hypothetical protein QM820_04570 [Minicystis sp.]